MRGQKAALQCSSKAARASNKAPTHLVQQVQLAAASSIRSSNDAASKTTTHPPTWYSECSWPGRSRPTYTIS